MNIRRQTKKLNSQKKLNVSKKGLDITSTRTNLKNLFEPYKNTYVNDDQKKELETKVLNILTINDGIIPMLNIKIEDKHLQIESNTLETFTLLEYIYERND